MTKREFPESQPKYPLNIPIPDAGTGRMRSPYPRSDGNWYFNDVNTEKRLVPFEVYRSEEVEYINGDLLLFSHGFASFNPLTDFYILQAHARCTIAQAGYNPGDPPILLNGRRGTLDIDSTTVKVQIGGSGIQAGRRNGNLNEFSLNSDRWRLFVMVLRKI